MTEMIINNTGSNVVDHVQKQAYKENNTNAS